MPDPAALRLSAWENFYVIVGSSGAALVGVQFVVIALIASIRGRSRSDAISAFATPTVVHFVAAFVVSAIMSMPWPSLLPTSVALAVSGLAGLVYGAIVIRRARRQTDYRPVWEDWLWYATFPSCAYAALTLAALFLRATSPLPLFVIGAAALALLLTGIHNAWDSVTHIVGGGVQEDSTETAGDPVEERAGREGPRQ